MTLKRGGSPVEASRLWRDYTVADLGWLSGVAAAEIAEHERGERELSPAEKDRRRSACRASRSPDGLAPADLPRPALRIAYA
jgi:hypothetical protein